jgi:hypothetical protein
MIQVTTPSGKKHYLHPDTIAQIVEARPSSQYRISCYVKLFDGTTIESVDDIAALISPPVPSGPPGYTLVPIGPSCEIKRTGSLLKGWKIVPLEPTYEMKVAGILAEGDPESPVSLSFQEVSAIYRAMVVAAKEKP